MHSASQAPHLSPHFISPFSRPLTPRSRFDGNAYRAPAASPPAPALTSTPAWSLALSPPPILPRTRPGASRAVSIAEHGAEADDERTIVPRHSLRVGAGSIETIRPYRAAQRSFRPAMPSSSMRWIGDGNVPAPSPEAFPWRMRDDRARHLAPPSSVWHHPASRPITASPPFRPGYGSASLGFAPTSGWGSPTRSPVRAPGSWRDPQDNDETFNLGAWVREIDEALAARQRELEVQRRPGVLTDEAKLAERDGVPTDERALRGLRLTSEEIGRYRAWKARLRSGAEKRV